MDNNGVMTWSPRLPVELGWPSSANVRQNVFGWSAGTADQHFRDWKRQAVNGEESWDSDSVKKVRSPTPVSLEPTPLPVLKARAIASASSVYDGGARPVVIPNLDKELAAVAGE